jgi:cell fate (sporulation/competence/biofilm development) regulator YlbF (YheA/YmcA/DUF963 family)
MDVMVKVNMIIDIIDNSDIVKQLKELKVVMDEDIDIQILLNNFNISKSKYLNDSIVTKELIEAKERLYEHPVVTKYRKLYSQLNISLVKFNKDLSLLLNNKKHHAINN